jgi:hypothetical protein
MDSQGTTAVVTVVLKFTKVIRKCTHTTGESLSHYRSVIQPDASPLFELRGNPDVLVQSGGEETGDRRQETGRDSHRESYPFLAPLPHILSDEVPQVRLSGHRFPGVLWTVDLCELRHGAGGEYDRQFDRVSGVW